MRHFIKKTLYMLACVQMIALPVYAETMIAVISPHQNKEQVHRDINLLRTWLLRMKKSDTILVLEGWSGNTLAQLTRPSKANYQSERTIVQMNKQGFAQLMRFANTRRLAANKQGQGTLHIPRLMGLIAQNYPKVRDIAFIGTANFNSNGTLPADEDLLQSSRKALYGTADVSERLKGKRFHWLLPRTLTPYTYENEVTRFIHLYIDKQAGELITFRADANLVTQRLFQKAQALPAPLALNRVSDPQPINSLFTRAPSGGGTVHAYQPQRVKIGIAWQGQVDLDIYGVLSSEKKAVYYANTQSRYATHHKDVLKGERRGVTIYEIITYNVPINLCDVKIGINHYSGASPHGIHGTLRVEAGDVLIAKPFHFSGISGNQGKDMSRVLASGNKTAHSVRLLLRDVMAIKGCSV